MSAKERTLIYHKPGETMPDQTGHDIGAAFTAILLLALALSLYMLPTIIAMTRSHPNTASIFVINLLLGWSILGWAGALAWAVIQIKPNRMTIDLHLNPPAPPPLPGPQSHPTPPPPPSGHNWLDDLR